MASFSLFKLEKLKISVLKKDEKLLSPTGTFEVMFNPETYSISYRNEYSTQQGIGTGGKEKKFARGKDSRISFRFIFDGTGVSEFGAGNFSKGKKDVNREIQKFLDLTTAINGDIHEPNHLRIVWGDLHYKCRLEDVQISYTLFDESGKPLRAELDTNFIGDIETPERLKLENRSSPDLTHKRLVKAYDTLPVMCRQIYGSESYYLKVAKANRLDDFRNLTPGQELFFPPVEK